VEARSCHKVCSDEINSCFLGAGVREIHLDVTVVADREKPISGVATRRMVAQIA